MVVSQRLDLKQSQTLVMTPQLQQAIKLLQMSNQELGEFVAKEIEQNPLLEQVDTSAEPVEYSHTVVDDVANPAASIKSVANEAEPQTSAKENQEGAASREDETWEGEGYSIGDKASSAPGRGGQFDDDDFSAVQNVAEKPSLRQHLLGQIQVDIENPSDRLIASSLVELLDETGYLPKDLELIRAQLGATAEHFEVVVKQLQRFDPPGIFARSLKECLALQLQEQNRFDPAMAIMLDHLDLIAKHEKNALIKLCGVDAEDVTAMIDEIRKLNPKPAQSYSVDVEIPIVPDVLLRAQPGGGWHVELNSDNLPRVLANEVYYARVSAVARSKTDKEYVSDRWQQANWLVKALHQRATTILKVASEIVRQQDNFFIHGVQCLKPLILKDIATAVEMHESTVSRVTQNKFIATPRGLFELKYFFTTALGRSDSGETVSSESVRERIRALIEAESLENILSDDDITGALHGEGIDIARRTVAKYREALRIASSAQRRREKRSRLS